jgi:hypothetical protein
MPITKGNALREQGGIGISYKSNYTTSNNKIDLLLSQLTKVKKTGHDQWVARCPSHDDRNPSLAIRDCNGTVLLKCFAGCSAFEIVSAIGMKLSDLFPESDEYRKLIKNPFPATDVLRCIQTESLIVATAALNIAKGKLLDKEDLDRLVLAASRIGACYD